MKYRMLLKLLCLFSLMISLGLWFIIRPAEVGAQGPDPGGIGAQAIVGNAFTYQGSLVKDGAAVTDSCNFQFGLWDDLSGGSQIGVFQTVNGVTVTNGSFAANLNGGNQFGSAPFTGSARYLSIAVQCSTDASFVLLSPRVALNPVPYALALPGLWTQQNATSPNIIGGYSGNSIAPAGEGITISGGGSSTGPNAATGNYSVIGGGRKNTASALEATVGGGADNAAGGAASTVSGGLSNSATGSDSTVSGGIGNEASGDRAVIGGGSGNSASGDDTVIGGGKDNTVVDNYSVIGGGQNNQANNSNVTISGGNTNAAGGALSTIGGGVNNVADGYAATIPGGNTNTAQGDYSFSAGRLAGALHNGTFVWGDSTNAEVSSTGDNQFIVRASGGVTMYTSSGLGSGVVAHAGSGSWSSLSDRNAKENVVLVDGRQVLARLVEMPVSTWNYKTQSPSIRHIGPMAQDFHAAFNLGESDTMISAIDADGVTIAALQGLYQLVQEQAAQIAALQKENAGLAARLATLEDRVGGRP